MIIHQFVIAATVLATGVLAQQQVHPCHGRRSGFARDLHSCSNFWRCAENPPTRGQCPGQNLFEPESERCVFPRNSRCFNCPQTLPYHLISVPQACHQFTRCVNGVATLHTCPSGLVFDGRNGIRNCNWRPAGGGCHREGNGNDDNNEMVCPSVIGARALYYRARDSCER